MEISGFKPLTFAVQKQNSITELYSQFKLSQTQTGDITLIKGMF
jgi:hypothetical protein